MTVIAREVRAKDGYILDDTPQSIKIKRNSVMTLEFRNQPKGGVLVKKVDAVTNAPISDVEFLVTDSDGNLIGNANGKYTTDSAGTFTITDITPGTTLVIKETRAKAGYILDDTPQTVKVKSNEVTTLEFRNAPKGNLIIVKQDSVTKEPLEGVEFKIVYADGSYVDAEGGTLSSTGLYWTDKEGEITISGISGTVVVTEIETIPGYTIDENTRTQTVVVNPNDTQTLYFYNTPVGGLQIIKSDKDSGKRIAGVKFEIRKMNGEIIGTYTTDSDGVIYLPEAESGWYTVTELETASGYLLDTTPHRIEVKDGQTATLEITNHKSSRILLHKVDKATGKLTDVVEYMTADVEDEYVVAQANEPLDEGKHFVRPRVSARRRDEILEIDAEKVDYMDVSPRMMVSVATACIPFLENDDCNRALMGSNMQRQAVPLMVTQQPIVATGMEYKAATDSGTAVLAKSNGVVEKADADHIVVRNEQGALEEYSLIKFARSNAGTCINQRPIVEVGETVTAGQVLADGPAMRNGEISLGKNALIGFMTWEGYNYEDAVLLNEKIVREDVYTSIHIEEYETESRDTKLGPEEITRDIPNVSEDALKDLDERGIIRIGAEVKSGDILVGKVTPKGETELTAEERLLRAIFGEKAREVRDTSLRVPHGAYGIIVDVKVFTPENSDELQPGVREVVRCYIAQKRKISVGDKMAGRHGNKGVVSRILPQEDMPYLPDGTPLDIVLNPLGVPSRMNIGQVLEVNLGYAAKACGIKVMTPVFDSARENDIGDTFDTAREMWHGENAPAYPTKLPKIMGEKGHIIDFSKIELDRDGKTTVYDGRTGEKFDNRVTVGYMYYLKLHHLVDDKIHARSTGPYSLVTQQPLGGKAQFGGQRFGEMEVWALEAYGAAYTLQEILTVKSDDVEGRVKTYEAIVKGEPIPQPGIPESFRVMLKELQSLGMDVVVQDKDGNEIDMRQNFDDEETGFDMRDVAGSETVTNENELLNDYTIKDADAGFDDPSVLEDDNSGSAAPASDEVDF